MQDDRFPQAGVNFQRSRTVFQILKSEQRDSVGGVCRRFLGLKEGHTYKVSARMNTLVSAATDDYSFSFHAAFDAPDGEPLSPAQMMGTAPLPSGESGPEAGQIARYGKGVTTDDGTWVVRTTDAEAEANIVGNLTVPQGVHSLTLWFRLEGRAPNGVGGNHGDIEDLDCSG